MEVDYGPTLPPCLGADHQNASDQHSGLAEVPSKVASVRPKKHTLIKSMTLMRGLPRINTQVNPMNLYFHLLSLKNMLTKVNIRLGPDTCLHLQRRISPLYPDTGLQSPLGLSLIKTNLNTIQTPLIIGK